MATIKIRKRKLTNCRQDVLVQKKKLTAEKREKKMQIKKTNRLWTEKMLGREKNDEDFKINLPTGVFEGIKGKMEKM